MDIISRVSAISLYTICNVICKMCSWFYSPWWRNQPSAGVFVSRVRSPFCWQLWLLGGLCSGFLCSCTQQGWGGWKELSWEPPPPLHHPSAGGFPPKKNFLCVFDFHLENDRLGSCLWKMHTSAPILVRWVLNSNKSMTLRMVSSQVAFCWASAIS